jgi:hypothetical protein
MLVLSGRENRILQLLCDANVIIEAYSIKKWHYLMNTHRVATGSVVANKECVNYPDKYQRLFIDLKSEVRKGRVTLIAASTQEVTRLIQKVFEHKIVIHAGETELIAIMLNPKYNELVFCTADKAAVYAAHVFDLLPRVVSFERCLGKSYKVKLPYKCTERRMEILKAEAIQYLGADLERQDS